MGVIDNNLAHKFAKPELIAQFKEREKNTEIERGRKIKKKKCLLY